MKKYLKSSGIIPWLLVVLSLILMTFTRAVQAIETGEGGDVDHYYGLDVLFNYASTSYSYILGRSYVHISEPSAAAITTFIFLTLASITLLLGALIPLLKDDEPLIRFSGLLNVISMAFILAAAIAIFFVPVDWSYFNTDDWSEKTIFILDGGYIFVCILSFVSSFLCLPSIFACLKKPKAEQIESQE